MDDILKVLFELELKDRDCSEIIRPYQSIQNKILVDYKKFIENILKKRSMIDSNFSVDKKSDRNSVNNITPRRTTPRREPS